MINVRCFQINYYNASKSALSLSSYITLSLNPSTHCRRWASLLVKSLEHWARKTNTRLFLDCSLAPTNWCHIGMLYPVEPELLINYKKPTCIFLHKIFVFFKITTMAKQKKRLFVAQIWIKDHTFATSKSGKKMNLYCIWRIQKSKDTHIWSEATTWSYSNLKITSLIYNIKCSFVECFACFIFPSSKCFNNFFLK